MSAGLRMFGRLLCAALLFAVAAAAGADPVREAAERRADLDALKERIRALQRDIEGTEKSHGSAATALVAAEREVSRLQRRLRQMAGERLEVERTIARLGREQAEVEARITARSDELAEWLRRHYVYGSADGVAPFLSSRDPNQIARDAHYLEHLGRARLALIDSLRGDLRQKAELQAVAQARANRLAELEAEQRGREAELAAMHEARRVAVAELNAQLQEQRREFASLRQDENRLGQLIEGLTRAAREQQRAREQAAARAQQQQQQQQRSASGTVATPGRPAERVVGQAREVARAGSSGVPFASLRGKLLFPVRGELLGRFGAPRAEGGTTWRGVFIRARSGEDVRAVADGEVVYSDWLRGFGNLIIIDHGSDYLTVYGNNDALLREVGDRIAGGDAIASVGASGGGTETGLYFEIRHQGQALDPMKWVRPN